MQKEGPYTHLLGCDVCVPSKESPVAIFARQMPHLDNIDFTRVVIKPTLCQLRHHLTWSPDTDTAAVECLCRTRLCPGGASDCSTARLLAHSALVAEGTVRETCAVIDESAAHAADTVNRQTLL